MTVRHVKACRQNPAYRPAIAPYFFRCLFLVMRRRRTALLSMSPSNVLHRVARDGVTRVGACLLLIGAFGIACGRAAVPPPIIAPTPPPVVPPAVVPVPARLVVASSVTERRYDVRSSARIERDSAGRKDEQRVESRGLVVWSLQRSDDGALHGIGRVDSFTVRIEGAGLVAPPPIPSSGTTSASRVPPSVAFDAVLDATTLRVVTRPPLANECDRPESGATALVRDLMLRIPTSLVTGDRWRDSSASVICRVGIPIIVRSQHDYLLERVDGVGSVSTLVVKRTTTTRLEGKLGSAWRALELAGSGTATADVRVDVTTGALVQIDGSGVLTLQLTDRSRPATPRTQRITQRLTTHASVRP